MEHSRDMDMDEPLSVKRADRRVFWFIRRLEEELENKAKWYEDNAKTKEHLYARSDFLAASTILTEVKEALTRARIGTWSEP